MILRFEAIGKPRGEILFALLWLGETIVMRTVGVPKIGDRQVKVTMIIG